MYPWKSRTWYQRLPARCFPKRHRRSCPSSQPPAVRTSCCHRIEPKARKSELRFESRRHDGPVLSRREHLGTVEAWSRRREQRQRIGRYHVERREYLVQVVAPLIARQPHSRSVCQGHGMRLNARGRVRSRDRIRIGNNWRRGGRSSRGRGHRRHRRRDPQEREPALSVGHVRRHAYRRYLYNAAVIGHHRPPFPNIKNAATPAAANHPHVGIDERSNPPITVEEDTAALPAIVVLPAAGLPTAAPAAVLPDAGAEMVNWNAPELKPPTLHNSFHGPMS